MPRRVAYCEVPKLAGVYTFAVNLAEHLPRLGYTLRLVGVGPQAAADCSRRLSIVPAAVLAADSHDWASQRDAFVRWLLDESIDIVMISGSETEQRLIPAIPPQIRILSIINNATRGQYRVGTLHHERMHRVVCVSPRLARDIVRRWGVPAGKVELIPYGVQTAPGADARPDGFSGTPDAPLRLVYLGRFCDSAKGIFQIPKILSILRREGVACRLTTVGDGPDGNEFRRRMERAGLTAHWTHLGSLRYDAVPAEMRRHDVQLLPSRHEGLPLTLLEGMAAGCVPVASRLHGITDYAIASPDEGVLCPVGKPVAFARAIIELDQDRRRLHRMSQAAARRARSEFTAEGMAARYARLFDAILAEPDIRPILPAGRSDVWSAPARRSWWRRIPAPVKNAIRTACGRVGVTV